MRELERRVLLSVMDRQWREHLYEMDYLQEGIGLRAMGQRDPLVEYQREGFDMFRAMMDAIKEEAVGFLFNVEVPEAPAAPPPVNLVATGPGETPGEVLVEQLSSADSAPGPAPAGAPVSSPAPATAKPAVEPAISLDKEQAVAAPPTVLPADFGRPKQPAQLQYTAPVLDSAPGSTGVTTSSGSSGGSAPAGSAPSGGTQSRNSPCACGSGRKFKRCHGDPRNS
jgi:preprotein translocase subunit SecA